MGRIKKTRAIVIPRKRTRTKNRTNTNKRKTKDGRGIVCKVRPCQAEWTSRFRQKSGQEVRPVGSLRSQWPAGESRRKKVRKRDRKNETKVGRDPDFFFQEKDRWLWWKLLWKDEKEKQNGRRFFPKKIETSSPFHGHFRHLRTEEERGKPVSACVFACVCVFGCVKKKNPIQFAAKNGHLQWR